MTESGSGTATRADVDLHESLDGQVALVTGATRGIGAETARQLAALDATVYAGGRDPADVTAEGLLPVQLDVTDAGDVETALGLIEEGEGRLDVLVNNAAVYGPAGKLERASPEEVEGTLRTNLHGPIQLTRAALPLLTTSAGSRVVNVSSGSGQFSGGVDSSHLPYAVSKAGLNAFTQGLARQYPGLLVNAVCPGWVRTDMGGPGASRSVERGAETPVWLARFREGSPSGLFWRDRAVIEW